MYLKKNIGVLTLIAVVTASLSFPSAAEQAKTAETVETKNAVETTQMGEQFSSDVTEESSEQISVDMTGETEEETVKEQPLKKAVRRAPAADGTKTLTVDASAAVEEGKTYTDIQSAINYLRSLGDENAGSTTDGKEDGWTINVAAGTYNRFNVINGVDGLTIQSSAGAEISVLDGSSIPDTAITYTKSDGKTATVSANQTTRINSGLVVNASNLTLDGLTFAMGTTKKSWQASAVEATNGDTSMERANGLTVKNCTFNGSGTGNGVFADNGLTTYTLEGNTFNNLDQGTYMEDYQKAPMNVTVTGNSYSGCNFAYHGSFDNNVDKGVLGGKLTFTGNTVTGTKDLRNKVIIQDSSDRGSTVVDISGNTLDNALIGTVNLDDDNDGQADLSSDPLGSNTFGENSYYVKAHEPGSIDYYSTYIAPQGSVGHWKLTGLDQTDWTDEQKKVVQDALDKANAEQSNKLSITGIDENNLIHTFTWFKNAVYWETYPHGNLEISKKVEGSDTDQAFSFKITLSGQTVDGKDLAQVTQTYGDIVFENGQAQFTLKNGESKKVTGLPVDVKYTVEEVDAPEEFTVSSENETGTIKENDKIAVTFTNKVKTPDQPETETETDQPETETETDQPETKPEQPETKPDQPETKPDQPETEPETKIINNKVVKKEVVVLKPVEKETESASTAVETGDNSNLVLWVVLFLASASAAGLGIYAFKKQH